MDNDVFRRTYREVNERFCVYEKAILTNQCNCSRARRFCIAEREGVHCRSEAAREQCVALLDLLRQESRFALKSRNPNSALGHGKAIRIQVGGLRGLLAALSPEPPVHAAIEDISATIEAASRAFGGLENLPFHEVIRHIAAYEGRSCSRRRR